MKRVYLIPPGLDVVTVKPETEQTEQVYENVKKLHETLFEDGLVDLYQNKPLPVVPEK